MHKKFTFLSKEECYGYSTQRLDAFSERIIKSSISDFVILLGGHVINDDYVDDRNKELKGRCGIYFLKDISPIYRNQTRVVSNTEWISYSAFHNRYVGARPVIEVDDFERFLMDTKRVDDETIEYGYYQMWAVSKSMQEELESAFNKGMIHYNGNYYMTDGNSVSDDVNWAKFNPLKVEEMEYKGIRYVRVIANFYSNIANIKLSNREEHKIGDAVWVEVEPIKWIVDKKHKKFVSLNVVFAGIKFCEEDDVLDFEKTSIYKFLNNYFSRDIVRSMNKINSEDYRMYDFDFSKITEEDIIKGCIMSDVPVFLHGQTGEGKSSRVKQFDPNVQIIYLQTATPESLNGRNVYNESTGESIDKEPTWYTKLCKRCEEEPDKLHIIFFDELTNATPVIQGMIYNIFLDREINGIWKLPKNARIVAAGNEKEESLSANELSAPMFSRFAHAYIDTMPEDFLRWGNTPRSKGERLNYEESKV